MTHISADHFARMFTDLVEQARADKVRDYFAPSATINLNGKELTYEEFERRIAWMSKRALSVQFEDALVTSDRAACVHYTSFTEEGKTSVFKVFSRMHLNQGKITRFEHMTLKMSGDAHDSVVNQF